MRTGTRKIIFSYLVKNIPYGSKKMVGTYEIGQAIQEMLVTDYRQECEEQFLKVFGTYTLFGEKPLDWTEKTAKTIEEAFEDRKSFSSIHNVEEALKWAAGTMYMEEKEEGVKWLIDNGYIREYRKPARFGYKPYLGITEKGWSIAHLYR